MALGEILYARLTTYAGTSALIGTRCYPMKLPQGPTLPAIAYQQIGPGVMEDERGVLERVRVQVVCWAGTYAGARALGRAAKDALDEYSGSSGGTRLRFGTVLPGFDLDDPETEQVGFGFELIAFVCE